MHGNAPTAVNHSKEPTNGFSFETEFDQFIRSKKRYDHSDTEPGERSDLVLEPVATSGAWDDTQQPGSVDWNLKDTWPLNPSSTMVA
jgi:hypothetical protein